jgi:glyoxylase-like metal-dependent hydrolase (beta-lactamase superfamily II)
VHVERFESALWQTTSLLLVSAGEAVVVDPCIASDEVQRIAARAHELDARVTHVLVTHADWDHICGIAVFPDAVAAMSPRAAERIRSGAAAPRLASAAAEYGLELPGEPRADLELEPGRAHALGPFVVETLALRGHTPDGLAYRIRSLDLLAVGDHLSPIEFPFASSTADYRLTLAGLADLLRHDPPAAVHPGHGGPLSATEALAIAEGDLAYLHELRRAVSDGLARDGPDAARAAGLAVAPPRAAAPDLARAQAANVAAQLAELASP